MARHTLTRAQRRITGVVAAGAALLAAIGFAGSYAAVRHLAESKGFGDFALVFPVGIDAGIGVLLALDLLLAWLRIPYAALRPAAWVLTAATIAFNAAARWPDPLAVGMHAVIPVLFVVVVEAARHAVGRIADITAERHVESVRLVRWLLAPVQTFRLWRRMRLWELRSYGEAIRQEQDRLIYRTQLEMGYGRRWRRNAPAELLMPLRLARYGEPVKQPAAEPTEASAEFVEAADQAVAVATSPEPAAIAPAPKHRRPQPPSAPAGPEGTLVEDVAELFGHAHAPIVYFISNGARVKIGTSQNLRRRISTLCLRPADLLFALHGDQRYEEALHARFTEQRVSDTEWFEHTGPLAEFIAETTGQPVPVPPVDPDTADDAADAEDDAPQVESPPALPAASPKSAWIVAASAELNPGASPADIAHHLAQQGRAVDTAYVRTVLSREAKKARAAAEEQGIGQGGEGYN